MKFAAAVWCMLCCCGGNASPNATPDGATPPEDGSDETAPDGSAKRLTTVFVVPFENKSDSQIYGNVSDAPYINSLLEQGAHATMFGDELPSLPSEPHYIWMEAGTNVFADHTFTNDADPSTTNSTNSTQHLVTQLEAAGVPWMAYQEGITSHTCPVASDGHYVAKHDPFVFFQDVVGDPPSQATARCADHHKAYPDLAADLAAGVTGYVFITPDLCHDMHGALTCSSLFFTAANIKAGDAWLASELPHLLAYTQAHDDAIIMLVWDEGDANNIVPFLVLGNGVRAGYASAVAYNHGSMLASLQAIFGVPRLAAGVGDVTFADMFVAGGFP